VTLSEQVELDRRGRLQIRAMRRQTASPKPRWVSPSKRFQILVHVSAETPDVEPRRTGGSAAL